MMDRRAAMAGLGGAATAFAIPAGAASRRGGKSAGRRLPPRLRVGDTVGIVSPSSAVEAEEGLQRAEWWVRGMGLVPRFGTHAADRHGYLAGTDANRAADINAMYADDAVRAVFAVRGGWGGARILPLLDWDTIRANPKLLIGYSDVTALHLAFAARAGFPTIHGGNASSSWPRVSWESLWRMAFAGEAPVLGGSEVEAISGRAGRTIRGGTARGTLLGGNLTILSTFMGTGWLPDFADAILFVEDTNESEYRIDRMLQQLRLAGVLGSLAGVVFGQCTGCRSTDPDYAGFTLDSVIDQYLAPLGVPAFTGANIGHVAGQLSLPSGAAVEIDADARTIRLLRTITA
ncbi:LD-carboxypeptidase [Altererythrobacter aerius]|uniref:LD-carboxypeptidase n=1 Tax=Tsuneonella aeria TaxID=1837929 RepID=A0A6I4TDF9_9SPHN|nr:LD-carboxypeptidase [Tsuneonella aeria]MXO75093.1 LD-carboxypeptidase [Tsuneonella aeria]